MHCSAAGAVVTLVSEEGSEPDAPCDGMGETAHFGDKERETMRMRWLSTHKVIMVTT